MDFSSQYSAQNITVLDEQNGILRVGSRNVNFLEFTVDDIIISCIK